MKIALTQLNYYVGDFEKNISKIKHSIQSAKKQKVDLIVFAEMAVCGFPPYDLLHYDSFVGKCQQAIADIAVECTEIAAIIGAPYVNNDEFGKRLYNSALLLQNGSIKEVRHKTLLASNNNKDEHRYFEPNKKWGTISFKGEKIALTIGEDLWNIDNYASGPLDILAEESLTIIINIAATPFHYDLWKERTEILTNYVLKYKLPLIYVNHVGGQGGLLFDGGSLALDKTGKRLYELKFFEEDFTIIDTKVTTTTTSPKQIDNYPPEYLKIGLIHDSLIMGIKDFFGKQGFTKAILGLSGGLDSAVVLLLAIKALGRENVMSVLMPSPYSSDHSITDAIHLLKNTKSPYKIINISEAYNLFRQTLEPVFGYLPTGATDENLQARIRGVYLMSMANNSGYLLLNNSNKSEAAVGYGTLYGDMNGGLSVIGDIYKTEVFELARYINYYKEVIPENIIKKPPSAELRPNQKDSDSLPDYDVLDKILYNHIEKHKSYQELIEMGFNKELITKTLRLVSISEYKRHQTPPILRVSPKAFRTDRKMPVAAKYWK